MTATGKKNPDPWSLLTDMNVAALVCKEPEKSQSVDCSTQWASITYSSKHTKRETKKSKGIAHIFIISFLCGHEYVWSN